MNCKSLLCFLVAPENRMLKAPLKVFAAFYFSKVKLINNFRDAEN